MEQSTVENLIKETQLAVPIIIDEDFFRNILTNITVPVSSKFYTFLPKKRQLIQETNRYWFFSLRRILRNEHASKYQLSSWKKLWESLASSIGLYSSNVLSRNLRADKDLISLMSESKHPYSLLCKLETYDYDNHNMDLFIITKPILVIPDTKNRSRIISWENANTRYQREVNLFPFINRLKRITPEEYLENQNSFP
ncbi:hypothetical protein JW851_03035 [Candidatus Woesearchaeota archaeon]|nr:hypothetical protein [Candidatus Woesearchaeota archaeon]